MACTCIALPQDVVLKLAAASLTESVAPKVGLNKFLMSFKAVYMGRCP